MWETITLAIGIMGLLRVLGDDCHAYGLFNTSIEEDKRAVVTLDRIYIGVFSLYLTWSAIKDVILSD